MPVIAVSAASTSYEYNSLLLIWTFFARFYGTYRITSRELMEFSAYESLKLQRDSDSVERMHAVGLYTILLEYV